MCSAAALYSFRSPSDLCISDTKTQTIRSRSQFSQHGGNVILKTIVPPEVLALSCSVSKHPFRHVLERDMTVLNQTHCSDLKVKGESEKRILLQGSIKHYIILKSGFCS